MDKIAVFISPPLLPPLVFLCCCLLSLIRNTGLIPIQVDFLQPLGPRIFLAERFPFMQGAAIRRCKTPLSP